MMNTMVSQRRMAAAVKIVAIYALFGIAWIYGSDTLLGWLVNDPAVMVKVAVIKGSLFIVCTATLLYVLINRFARQLEAAEGERLESLKSYQAIFNATNEAILVHDAENGRILDVNDQMLEIYGYNRAEALALDVGRISAGTYPYTQDVAVNNVRKAMTEGPQVFEWLCRKHSGELFWTEVSLKRVTIADFDRIIAVVRDVSERKQAEAALKKNEETHRIIVNSAMDGFWLVTPQGRLLEVNDAYCRMSGYGMQELLGMNIADLDVVESQNDAVVHNMRIMEQGWDRFVARHRRKDGTVFDVEVSAMYLPVDDGLFVGFLRDVTESRKTEEELREAQELFSLFMKYSPIYAYIKQIEEDQSRIVQLSDNFIDMVGRPAQDLLGCIMPDVFPEEFARKITDDDIMVVNQGKVIHLEEVLNGRNYITVKFPLIRAGRKPLLAGFTIDVTDRKRAEEERLNLEKQLLHAQKLESLGVLAGGIAHDFNNLLAAILGNLDLALMRLAPGSPAIANIEKSIEASRRAADLTRQMLAYAGKGLFQLQAMNVNEIVIGNTDLLRTVVPRNITLTVATDSALPCIMADPGQIQQVVMNLITNAAEAIQGTGVIGLATGHATCDDAYIQQSVLPEKPAPGEFVYIEVSDSGSGMDEETQRRLFDPFFTTKFTGRGLGMAATQGIVKAHNGMIMLESREGQGSIFRILFPVAPRPTPLPAQQHDDRSPCLLAPAAQSRGKMLIVDDEVTVRDMCADFARHFGYEPLEADNGADAVEIFRQLAGEIIIAVVDLTMPVMDGVATFHALKEINPEVRIILCSGFGAQSVDDLFSGSKPDAFMQKPFQASEFEQKIKHALSRTT